MSLILVVEPEARYIERIHDALGADGWKVQSVAGHDEALAAVASHSPDLILVSARAAGAERVVSAFSRRAGGPGVLVLLPEGEEANGRFGAEDRLGKPFTAQELRLAVKRAAAARREAPSAPAPAAAPGGPKLTSRQIFGDMLAEVEDEIQKKLEQTLSGMLAVEPKAAPVSPPRKAEAKPADDVDALISKTLTGMRLEKELGRSKAGVAPAAKTPVVAAPAASPKPSAMEQLEELTRSRRPAAAKAAPAPAEPPRPAAAPAPDPAATVRVPVPRPEEASRPGEKFGQYTLLERIAVGGMAELYKARMSGVEGFQKTVAIKRILPHLTDNAEFVEMFIDEGKLAAQLTHPNIAHIYDLGKIGRDYYIAMEFVEGKDLRSALNLARGKGLPLPMGLALLIAARLASALDYAHRKRDFDGHEMGLVHRDVSPQNILLTREGDIKLVDFGIAKAVSKASQTQIGALKGKLQYMSPEQAWGRPVDGRSDIFSLGSVLFELLTGERLFAGDSEISVLEAVREGRTRSPREVNPAVPAEVDALVLRALAVEPAERYATAGELQQRLEGVLYSLRPTPGHSDLAAYLAQLLEAEPTAAVAAAEAAVPAEPEPREPSAPTGVRDAAAAPVETAAVGEMPAMALALPFGDRPLGEEGRRGRGLLVAAMLGVVAVGVLLFLLFGRSRGPEAAPTAAPPRPAAVPARSGPVRAALPAPGVPGGPAAAASTTGLDVDRRVTEELAKRQEELERRGAEEKQRLERELEATRLAAAKKAEADAARAEAEARPPEPAPAVALPAAPEPEPQPARQEPEPAPEEPAPIAAEPEPEAPRTREGDLVQLGPGVAPPQLVSYDKPQYPAAAKRLGVQGVVVIALLVDEEGRVQEARVAEGVKQAGGLNEAALAAARTARYRPATKDGVRVKLWTRLRVPFKL